MAAMSRMKKFSAFTWPKSGASSTPARPANRLESIQATVLMRSASTPVSSAIRGLSTTARMRRPSGDQRKSAISATTATTVTSDGGHLVAVDGVVTPAVDGRAGDLAVAGGMLRPGLCPNHSLTISGMATSRPSEVTSRAMRGAERRWRKRVRSRTQPEQRGHHQHGHSEGRPRRPLVAGPQVVEHRGGDERLRPEGQVEDTRRLVGEHQAHREQGEHAPDGNAPDHVVDELGHRRATGGPRTDGLRRTPRARRAAPRRRWGSR